ncbi:MAG TPA: hypothetical protein VJZ03_04025 [Candidatus Bathyarchaeia archaeon]|nr:hypothetical protein [Candidatus Bathyarchaeia archaeon]
MTFTYFVSPIYTPIAYPPSPFPVVYYPLKSNPYRFPMPVLYSAPPPAVY